MVRVERKKPFTHKMRGSSVIECTNRRASRSRAFFVALCTIWRHQDLFRVKPGSIGIRDKPGDIVINAVDGSGDGQRSRRARSGQGWTRIAA